MRRGETAKKYKIDLLLGKSQTTEKNCHLMIRLVSRMFTENRLVEAKHYSQQIVLWKDAI